jgi:Beta-lactamase
MTVCSARARPAGIQAELVPGAFHDFDLLAEWLTAEVPIWEARTTHGYNAITIGAIEGGLVRRITGSIGTFLRDEVAGPLDDRIG